MGMKRKLDRRARALEKKGAVSVQGGYLVILPGGSAAGQVIALQKLENAGSVLKITLELRKHRWFTPELSKQLFKTLEQVFLVRFGRSLSDLGALHFDWDKRKSCDMPPPIKQRFKGVWSYAKHLELALVQAQRCVQGAAPSATGTTSVV